MSTISMHGKRFSEQVAKSTLKEAGVAATKANLGRLAQLSPDDGNNYLARNELAKGARALVREMEGGKPSGSLVPNKPIGTVLRNPPASLSRYSMSVSEDRTQLTFDPRQPTNLLATRAMGAKSVNVGHTVLGGVRVSISNDAGETSPFKDAKWVKKSFADVVTKKGDLERLKQNGYDVNAKRDVLVANTEADSSPTIFALRDLSIDGPAPQPKGGPNVRLAKIDDSRGFVAICSETTIEWFGDRPMITVKKPVVYLYPTERTSVTVKVDVVGDFTAQYPETKNGTWKLVAMPDGTLFDPVSEKKYGYLFWEAANPGNLDIDPAQAFCVRAGEAESFLENACRRFGLDHRETTDFVSYWIAALKRNPVSMVQFLSGSACDAYARMVVEPAPRSEIRMFMLFRAIPDVVPTGNPAFPLVKREGFTVVEWGGANLDE